MFFNLHFQSRRRQWLRRKVSPCTKQNTFVCDESVCVCVLVDACNEKHLESERVCLCVCVCGFTFDSHLCSDTHPHKHTHRYSAEGPIRGRVVIFLNQSERKIHLKIIE